MSAQTKESSVSITSLKESLKATDPAIRLNAALDMAKAGDPGGIPELIEGFRADSFVTRLFHAGKALVGLGDAAVPMLEAALTSDHETVRVDAAYTLWQIDPSRADELMPVALEALSNWNPELSLEEVMRTPLIDVVTFIGDMGPTAAAAVPILADMLQTPVRLDDPEAWNEDPRAILATLMTQIAGPAAETVEPLILALQSTDDSLRWGAARALGEIGMEASQAIPALASMVTDEQEVEAIRIEAAYSLAVMGEPLGDTLPVLAKAVSSRDWWVRAYAARILGEMGMPESNVENAEELFWLDRTFFSPRTVRRITQPDRHIVPLLIKALTDEDYNVRRNAVYALSLVNGHAVDAIPHLVDALHCDDIGPVAAESLAMIGTPAIPALLTMLEESQGQVQSCAAYTIQLIDSPEAHDALRLAEKKGIEPLQPTPNHFYVQCHVNFDERKKADFEALYQETIAQGPGRTVAYQLRYPKHEFLRYLVEFKGLFMHGTDLADLEILRPLRDSTDSNEHGNVSGVYADKGYMRPIYFAVVHRGRCFGLHNGFFDLREDGTVSRDEDQGLDRRYYKLTIGVNGLRRNAWRNGTVYALPPDTFEHWNEWTSRAPVEPVLRLPVTPHDLPLKDDVWGTDYRHFSAGSWVNPEEDAFPFLKDVRATPFHPAGRPPWMVTQ